MLARTSMRCRSNSGCFTKTCRVRRGQKCGGERKKSNVLRKLGTLHRRPKGERFGSGLPPCRRGESDSTRRTALNKRLGEPEFEDALILVYRSASGASEPRFPVPIHPRVGVQRTVEFRRIRWSRPCFPQFRTSPPPPVSRASGPEVETSRKFVWCTMVFAQIREPWWRPEAQCRLDCGAPNQGSETQVRKDCEEPDQILSARSSDG